MVALPQSLPRSQLSLAEFTHKPYFFTKRHRFPIQNPKWSSLRPFYTHQVLGEKL
jgi:hypothetical protein